MGAKKEADEAPVSFEASLEELETIVAQLESGAKPLEESLKLYEQGIAALRKCHGILDQAEKRIKILVKGAQGEPILGDAEGFGEEPAESPKSKSLGQTGDESGQKTTGQGIDSGDARGQNRPSSTTKPGGKGGSKAGGGSLFGSAQ